MDILGSFIFSTYPIPVALTALGSIVIICLHLITQPEELRQVMIVLFGFSVAVLPALIRIGLPLNFLYNLEFVNSFQVAALVLIPGSYFYAIFYRQMGGLEVRASSALSMIAYGVLIFLVNYLVIFSLVTRFNLFYTPTSSVLAIAIANCLFTILFYPHFRRLVENRLLHIPLPPQILLTTYSSRIITAHDYAHLATLLRDHVLPSLMVRQVVLLRIRPGSNAVLFTLDDVIFTLNIDPEQFPKPTEVAGLLLQAGRPRSVSDSAPGQSPDWVRLPLSNQAAPDIKILLLLGRRDPDDYYAPSEIPILQALVDNTTLAVANIEQTRLLHALYQEDINRREQERTRLAHDLHDDVLNQLAVLVQALDDTQENEAFERAYQTSVQRVREIISGLHPPLLNFGLGPALNGLVDEILGQSRQDLTLEMAVLPSAVRYPIEIELHLFRIVQQACLNAVKHSQASKIEISGSLSSDQVDLQIEDNGIGINHSGPLELDWLLANQHFGLAWMFERADLIGARLEVNSQPGKGTRITLKWRTSAVTILTNQVTSRPVIDPLSSEPKTDLAGRLAIDSSESV